MEYLTAYCGLEFPAEQALIVHLLFMRTKVGPTPANITLHKDSLEH